MYLYDKLKDNPNYDMVPRTFIFAGKAAPGYYIAKEIIKLINSVARKINNDLTIKDKLKVIFYENYNVSAAELLIPAADVSEQISTAGKEASGTGNMKFMMNGAITLATLDGANVEIKEAVGEDNIIIFGLTPEEVESYSNNQNYKSKEMYHTDKIIKHIMDGLLNRRYHTYYEEFHSLFDILYKYNDNYFILKDFHEYRKAQEKINDLYRNRDKWLEVSLINIANSGKFSSDYTVKEYADDIWNIKSILKEEDDGLSSNQQNLRMQL
jgi:starch phosphorylase